MKDKISDKILNAMEASSNIEITKKEFKQFKKELRDLEIKDKSWKGVQPIDMLIESWRGKKNIAYYGGEIKIK